MDTVHIWLTPSSMHFATAIAFAAPVQIISTSSDSITVPTPTVSDDFGTWIYADICGGYGWGATDVEVWYPHIAL